MTRLDPNPAHPARPAFPPESADVPYVSGDEFCDWLCEEAGAGWRLPWSWHSPGRPASVPPLKGSFAYHAKVRKPSAARGNCFGLGPEVQFLNAFQPAVIS